MMKYPKSVVELGEMFATDDACLEYLVQIRWREGFRCEICNGEKAYPVPGRKAIRCANAACDKWYFLTAGTTMEKSKTSLRTWFAGAYILTTARRGMSALQFQQQLEIPSYKCAFQMIHKLRAAIVAPERTKLAGEVELNKAYIGSRQRAAGRKAQRKVLVIGAVEVGPARDSAGKRQRATGRVRLLKVTRADQETVAAFVEQYIKSGTIIHMDGAIATMPWVSSVPSKLCPHIQRVFANLNAWILGTFHGVSPKHLQSYLNEFMFRYNRSRPPWTAFNIALGLITEHEASADDQPYGNVLGRGLEQAQ